jgi:threonylcarbamoyladenosine tRNA methylthiotransferase MtaB
VTTVAFYTLGCKLNQYETEAIRQQLEEAGYRSVDFDDDADVYIINTCTVTHRSDQRCRQMIRRAARKKGRRVVITGCYAQRDAASLSRIPGVDLVLGNAEKGRVLEFLQERVESGVIVSPMEQQTDFPEMDVSDFSHHTRAFVKIQDGCDGHCTYCVVPLVRGRSRSRSFGAVTDQIETFLRAGYREIVLTGVNLGRYRDPAGPRKDLLYLLRWLEDHPLLGRARLSSIEPTDFTDELIDLLGRSEKICRHVHIPMQSAADDVLRAMGRPYSSTEFAELIEKLHVQVSGIAIGVDVIVGFPGEDEAQFQATRRFLERLPICRFHVFSFSRREGTPAATMPRQVPAEVCSQRSRLLRDLSQRKFDAFQRSFLQQTLIMLTEHRRDRQTGLLTGLTDNYIRILADGPDELANRMLPVRLERMDRGHVRGRLISDGKRI